MYELNTDKYNTGLVLLRIAPCYGIDSLEMAVKANCKNFVSQSSVQLLITDIWNAKFDINKNSILDTFKVSF